MTTNGDALVALSASAAREQIGRREISPVELLDACIARIDAVNPAVNALAATCFERARAEAREAEAAVLRGDALGALHGLPLGVKDLEETGGVLTTYGSAMFKAHVPAHDNAFVARLRAAGAILAAKTNTPEMGAGANTRNAVWGATGNPFDPALNAGGSSGGSAVALATGMLPLATGSDMGGSLRIPAALCGVVGFRPSAGLVPGDGRLLGWSPLWTSGPMGREVADVRLLLGAMAGAHDSDPLSYPVDAGALARREPVDLGALRVGYTEDFGVCDVDDATRATFRAKIAALAPRVRVCEPAAFELDDVHRCFDVLRAESFVASVRETWERDPALLGPNTRANYEASRALSLADAVWAQARQTQLFRSFQRRFAQYDVIVSPVSPATPFPWTQWHLAEIGGRPLDNYYRWCALTYVVSLLTNPALALPCGVDHAGMPFGLQLTGPFRGDARVLDIAQSLETAFGADPALRRPVPDLARLAAPTPALKSVVTDPPLVPA